MLCEIYKFNQRTVKCLGNKTIQSLNCLIFYVAEIFMKKIRKESIESHNHKLSPSTIYLLVMQNGNFCRHSIGRNELNKSNSVIELEYLTTVKMMVIVFVH